LSGFKFGCSFGARVIDGAASAASHRAGGDKPALLHYSFQRQQSLEALMEGAKLLITFSVLALVAVVIAGLAGLAVDNLNSIHDLFSVMVFFCLVAVLLTVAWPIAVRLTKPSHPTQA
jgi:hypothetical protein